MKFEGSEADALAITIFLLTSFISLLGVLFNIKQNHQGPLRFPILGNLTNVYFHKKYPDIPSVLSDLAKTWGDVMNLKIGRNETVVFSSHTSAIAILNHRNATNREVGSVMSERLLHKNIGINFSNGPDWHDMRSFTMTSLKSHGICKFSTEILDEAQRFVQNWDMADVQESFYFDSDAFGGAVFNVVWRLLSGGQRFDYDDQKLKCLLNALKRFNESANLGIDIYAAFPGLKYLLPSRWTGKDVQLESLKEIRNFCYKKLKEIRENLKSGEKSESFFDSFAAKILESSENDACFNDDQFVLTTMDMFQNAVDTVGSTLTFLVLYSIINPEAKKKVQEEIEGFSIEDFKFRPFKNCHLMLPYTSAFIMETMRFSCALPMIAPRVATQDINLDDFHIKAGTSLLVNLRALNSSKEAWNDPENFRPDRFLEPSSGQLDNLKTRLMLSFGAGKRVCPSQKFAEQILLIFFVNLMKTYDFLPAPDAPLPSITKWFGLSYSPKPFYTQVKGRHKSG